MKIFGFEFTTKKELRVQNLELKCEIEELIDNVQGLEDEVEELSYMVDSLLECFPFYIGQTVYDVALKNDKGRYTKTNPSFEHCTITEVTVNDKNYFGLVKRLNNNDVFLERDEAEEYLKVVCNHV